jgi:protein tyrosine phosphatase (PTP) superfamily phosphohydrolase (DUF442 family)
MNKIFFVFLLLSSNIHAFGQNEHSGRIRIPEMESEIVLIDTVINLYQVGDFFISGQPDDSVYMALKKLGLGLVINVRTPQEMEALKKEGFDEHAFLDSLGISYTNTPIGGEAGFTTEAIEKINEALHRHSGKVMIHCRTSNRATMAWVAWLINHRDMPVNDAFALGRKMQLNLQMEDLLGYELSYDKK